MKLAHAAFLRPLAAKHRSHIIKLARRLDFIHLGFHVSAHDAGGALRSQRELGAFGMVRAPAVAICESIHLLFDDVRGLADGAAK